MPSLTHEALVQLVRRNPELVLSLIWPEGQIPSYTTIHLAPADFVDLNFPEYRADLVLAIGDDPDRPEGILIIEGQIDKDPQKHESWPNYITSARCRFHCPAAVVVLAPDAKVAAWAATPIDLGWGRGFVRPWVFGPADIPVITDPDRARAAPELAVLSLIAHANEPEGPSIALAAAEAASELDDERNVLYLDIIFGLLGPRARHLLEQLMPYAPRRYFSEIFQEHFDRGLAEGEAKGEAKGLALGEARGELRGKVDLLLKLLALKQFALTDADRQRILGCTDSDLLDTWATRVLSAESLRDVLGDAD